MSKFIGQITDFSKGEITGRIAGVKDPNTVFNGFLLSDETLYTGAAITKRPPLKYISPLISKDFDGIYSTFLTPPDEDGVEKFLYSSNGTGQLLTLEIVIMEKGELRTVGDPGLVTSSRGEGNNIICTTTPEILTSGEDGYLAISIGRQKMDYVLGLRSIASGDDIIIRQILGDKIPFLEENYYLTKTALEVYTFSFKTYTDFTPWNGFYLYVSATNSILVDSNGTLTKPTTGANNIANKKGDTVTVYQNKLIIGKSKDKRIIFDIFVYVTQPNGTEQEQLKTLTLQSAYGQNIFWVRSTSSGVMFASDFGIYLATLADDGGSFKEITRVSETRASAILPIVFRDFIIFVDSGGLNVNYIRFDRFQTNAILQSLGSNADLMDKNDYIIKVEKFEYKDEVHLLFLTSQKKVITGTLIVSPDGRSGGISYCRWFPDYSTDDIVVAKNGRQDMLYWIGTIDGKSEKIVCSCILDDTPLYREEEENRIPHIDFYSLLETKKMFGNTDGQYPTINVTRNNGTEFDLVAYDDFFFSIMSKVTIRDGPISIRIEKIIDSKNATGVIRENTQLQNSFTMSNYELTIQDILGLNYLVFFANAYANQRFSKIAGDVDSKASFVTKKTALYNGRIHFSVSGSTIYIGVPYVMKIITASLTTPGSVIAANSAVSVFMTILGRREATVYTKLAEKTSTEYHRARYTFMDDNSINKQYTRQYKWLIPSYPTNNLYIELISDSTIPPYITTIGLNMDISEI